MKRTISTGIVCVMTTVLFSGCATKATPENLLRDMEKNAEKTKSAMMNMKMSMEMSSDSGDISMEIDMDMESTASPEASHAIGKVSAGMSGMNFDVELETYSVTEGEEYATYTLMEDQWTREVSDAEELADEVDRITENMAEYADRFELSESPVTVNDQDCYELTGELDGDLIGDMMQTDMMDDFSGYDIDESVFSNMVFPCRIAIYQDSILPARVYVDMTDTFTSLMEDAGISISECYMDITFMEYDTVDEITVPEEALSEAIDVDDAGDGSGLSDDDGSLYSSEVKPAEPVEPDSALGDDWTSYTVQVNETVISFPCSADQLEEAGLKLDTEYTPEDYMVNAGEYELAWFMDESGDSIMVDMVNTGTEAKEIKDCQVGTIYADAHSMINGSLKVIFPGGIQIGSSEEELLSACGDPDDSYDDDEYGSSYFWYGDDSFASSCNVSITPDTGLVESVSVDCGISSNAG